VIKRNGGTYCRIELSTIVLYDDKGNRVENVTGQGLELNYKYTKKNGESIMKNRKSYVAHDYCPFCGTKYPSLTFK